MTVSVSHLPRPPGLDPARTRVRLLGLPIDPISLSDVDDVLETFVGERAHRQIVTVNLDFVSLARRMPRFMELIEDASLVVPDGAPVLWALRARGHDVPSRITGPDLIRAAVRHSNEHSSRVYFLGGDEGVAQKAADVLRQEIGDFNLVGVSSPVAGVNADRDREIARAVREADPDFVFVGFGCPKQDYWIRDHAAILDRSICVGVGGSFNYISGAIKRAPQWAQRSGLEWMFRMKAEPRRLARRYFIDDLPVMFHLWRDVWFGGKSKEGTRWS